MTQRVLLVGGVVYSPSDPFATAMLIDEGTIAWIGEDTAAEVHRDGVDKVVHLQGRLVTPGFVDAHIHATSTGLMINGLDLSTATSRRHALELISQACAHAAADEVVLGHGWDETAWVGDHDDRRLPTRLEIDSATAGRAAYLSRIDVHSALVSTALVNQASHCADLDGYSHNAPLSRQAHLAVRDVALASITAHQREQAHRAVRELAAAQGIVCLQENAGPSISSESDLRGLLQLAQTEPGPQVHGYWAELASEGGIERARDLGAIGVAGDLFVDGAIGSRTACLCSPYADSPQTSGASYLSPSDIAAHVIAATNAGVQAGFHVIGDQACANVTAGLRTAAAELGAQAVRSAVHRIEHAEMLSDDDISTLRELGVVASMQPLFDDLWGGSTGMYQERLGDERRQGMNRFADLASAGVALAFSSDAPVTAMSPWAAVRAAAWHRTPDQRISVRAAFSAHTRGSWRAMRRFDAGVLATGAPAHLAVWDVDELDVQVPDGRVSAWSTDPRSATPPLPVLDPDSALPTCVATMVDGEFIHGSGTLSGGS